MKVFDHPRCANCHGAFVVTDDNRSADHLGDHIPLIISGEGESEDPLERLRGRDPNVVYPATRCLECHVNAPPLSADEGPPLFLGSWRQPLENPAKMWGGMGALSVCKALFNFSDSPNGLIAHINDDPLIALGFEGMRGMDPPRLMTSEGAEPPPLSKPQLIGALRGWMDAMEFREAWPPDGDQSCGWVTGGAPPPAVAGETPPTPTETPRTEEEATPTTIPTSTPAPTSTPTPTEAATPTWTPTPIPTATRLPTSSPTATRPPTATAEPYWIFVLPQVSPGSTSGGALYVSTESDVRTSTSCSFEGGGIGCPSSERVQYQKLDSVAHQTKDAALAGLRGQITECQNRAITGWYGRARGQWYGLWNVPNKFSGGPGGVCP